MDANGVGVSGLRGTLTLVPLACSAWARVADQHLRARPGGTDAGPGRRPLPATWTAPATAQRQVLDAEDRPGRRPAGRDAGEGTERASLAPSASPQAGGRWWPRVRTWRPCVRVIPRNSGTAIHTVNILSAAKNLLVADGARPEAGPSLRSGRRWLLSSPRTPPARHPRESGGWRLALRPSSPYPRLRGGCCSSPSPACGEAAALLLPRLRGGCCSSPSRLRGRPGWGRSSLVEEPAPPQPSPRRRGGAKCARPSGARLCAGMTSTAAPPRSFSFPRLHEGPALLLPRLRGRYYSSPSPACGRPLFLLPRLRGRPIGRFSQ